MHPAPSIIFFTVASGLGYGLAIVLALRLLDPAEVSTKVAHVLALLLIGGGLFSSTLHLGNPQRAWRAFSQWRSSWLSREGVMAVATFIPLVANAGAAIFFDRWFVLPGLLGAACAVATIYCTAMIYASLRSVDAWHTPLTPACYLLFAGSGGLVAGASFAAAGGGGYALLSGQAVIALAISWSVKLAWRNRMLNLRSRSTPETATGLGRIGKVNLFEPPHTNPNYLTREMGFRIARKHARKLAILSLAIGGLLPALLLAMGLISGEGTLRLVLSVFAAGTHALGMVVERWLFFAEARHAVTNYYGGEKALLSA